MLKQFLLFSLLLITQLPVKATDSGTTWGMIGTAMGATALASQYYGGYNNRGYYRRPAHYHRYSYGIPLIGGFSSSTYYPQPTYYTPPAMYAQPWYYAQPSSYYYRTNYYGF